MMDVFVSQNIAVTSSGKAPSALPKNEVEAIISRRPYDTSPLILVAPKMTVTMLPPHESAHAI
jgi:hypothetical protein